MDITGSVVCSADAAVRPRPHWLSARFRPLRSRRLQCLPQVCRRMYVRVCGAVPQGTLSGPKCFLVYINDLRTTVPLYKYVDDSRLFEICDRKGVSVIQESVDIAARWTEQNDMNINSKKSKEIIISFAQDGNFRSTIPNIKNDGRDIAHVCHAKLLGVTISQDLTRK